MRAMHDPLRWQSTRQFDTCRLQPIDELGAKHLRKVPGIEDVALGELAPLSSPHIDPTTGNDDMQMRVVVQPPTVRMQYRGEAELRLQLAVVAAKRLECRCGRLEPSASVHGCGAAGRAHGTLIRASRGRSGGGVWHSSHARTVEAT